MRSGLMVTLSGYFGVGPTGVYPLPEGIEGHFISNNPNLKWDAEANGWRFHMFAGIPMSADLRINSLQSKLIKFLQFDTSALGIKSNILYIDHKLKVEHNHLAAIVNRCDRALLIRTHPKTTRTLQEEVNASKNQKRYAEVMAQTVQWINHGIANEGFKNPDKVAATGLIYYTDPEIVRPLINRVFNTCWLLGQPQCQIIWSLLAQSYEQHIRQIPWTEIEPLWREPEPSSQ